MDNKLIYIQAINFMKIFYAWGGKWSSKKKAESAESRKMVSRLFPNYLGRWILFMLNQNASHAINFDNLWIVNI